MILHFYLHWPQRFRLDIWPYSVYYAVWIWNYFSDTTTPIEVFTKAAFLDHKHLQRTRVFGCPVYVLAPTLQDAKKLPKWHKRSWKGVFLEFSPLHHTTVALVLNPDTGNITPQYHVVFDETFSTISSSTTMTQLRQSNYGTLSWIRATVEVTSNHLQCIRLLSRSFLLLTSLSPLSLQKQRSGLRFLHYRHQNLLPPTMDQRKPCGHPSI
jgi:hypothetical protein